jgi:hypothetical protein
MPGSRTQAPRYGKERAKQVESRPDGSSKELRAIEPRERQSKLRKGEPRQHDEHEGRRAVRRRPCNAREQEEEAEQ